MEELSAPNSAWQFSATSLLAKDSYFCRPVDYTWRELGIRMASVSCCCCFSKAMELLDMVFFIFWKKPEQITFLHISHHGTRLFSWWAGVKDVPGGQAFFTGMTNSLDHVVMDWPVWAPHVAPPTVEVSSNHPTNGTELRVRDPGMSQADSSCKNQENA
ncbi:elongation of very long chain fatty acids protein 1-like isoform X2 [Choloepus didactylus]|uniref:elongation of very long chain fatty acids protein 1-like isoform X2 n=1 Tax=Choloepus didactylus TaxID=27675 RepID=UPI00189CB832|nr:elongation of very long chain fatty acids protein 1-like isoform X2 [Choloepus didactylus]